MLITKLKKNNGYTLIEILIAIILFSIILIPLYGKLDSYLKLDAKSKSFDEIYKIQNQLTNNAFLNSGKTIKIDGSTFKKHNISTNLNVFILIIEQKK